MTLEGGHEVELEARGAIYTLIEAFHARSA